MLAGVLIPNAARSARGWAQVELYQPSPTSSMSSTKTLEQRIMQVLENNDGKCLDNEAERQEVVDDLFEMLDWYLADRGI